MKHILWPTGGVREALYNIRIARELGDSSVYKTTYITDIKESAQALAEKKVSHFSLGQLFEKAAGEFPSDPQEMVARANAAILGFDLNMIVHGDHYLCMILPRESAQLLTAKTILAYDWLFRHEKFDYIVRYGGNNLNFWVPTILGEKYNIPRYILTYAGLFARCGIQTGGIAEQWSWLAFDRYWAKYKGSIVSDEDKKKLDTVIADYVESHSRAPRSRLTSFRERWKQKKFKDKLKMWRSEMVERFNPPIKTLPLEKVDGYLKEPDLQQLEVIFNNHMQESQRAWQRKHESFVYDQLPEKYIYFPFNQPYDAPHRCWNPMNFLQEYVARIAYHSLPVGYELVVKEHPYSCGHPSYKELRSMQKLGIKVVHPNHHSIELIKNSAAVFCGGDTTGWEAIMLNRPFVVYCAQPFYCAYPMSINVSNPNAVHHALREAVNRKSLTLPQQEQRYAFLRAVYESGYPGNIWSYKGLMWTEKDESDENLKIVARMLRDEIEISSLRETS